MSTFPEKMTPGERHSVFGLATIMSLRMVGLFMVLPLFSLYAAGLSGATPTLVGLGMGIYGLAQALFQVPFGTLSDRVGRKPLIACGLVIFIAGSLIAGFAHSIFVLIAGRALQGIGAVGSTILAMIADLTRETQRAKAMAIAGITIGFAFMLAMLLGPVLAQWLPVQDLFFLAAFFGFIGIVLLVCIPFPRTQITDAHVATKKTSLLHLIANKDLFRLNMGIFFLHAIFTANFIVIPISLLHEAGLAANKQWLAYFPSLLFAAVVALSLAGIAERRQQIKPYFLASIGVLILSELLLLLAGTHLSIFFIGLCAFFASFSLLEAFLPSLVSRTAPPKQKGAALGLYSTTQFLGIFIGGVLGGWLYGKFHFFGVYLFCVILALLWFAFSIFMQPPRLKEQ